MFPAARSACPLPALQQPIKDASRKDELMSKIAESGKSIDEIIAFLNS